jgi:serine/threonine-protein kinase
VTDASSAAGLVGSVLDGRYRLDALLGEGGMGAVFRAHHLAMDRKVAVKLLKPHLSHDEIMLQRFAREARATMRVDSPHAVKVLDFGVTPQHDYYMVLEYLDGRSVQRELDVDGAFDPPRVVHIATQALHALGAAHKSGIIHRDIKPENVLLLRVGDDPDHTKLLDFGVAKLMEGAARSDRSALALTQRGTVFGTPEYMSPEQACGLPLDGRSDLYSLAVAMFAMLTGCAMYQAKTALEWLTMHATKPAPHLEDVRPELSRLAELDQLLQRCLAKRRDDRPPDAETMAKLLADLEPTLRDAPSGPRGSAASTGRLQPARSAFVETLPPELATATTGSELAVRRRAGVWLGLGALCVAALVTAAIVLVTRQRSRPEVTLAASGSAAPVDAALLAADAPVDPRPAAAADAGTADVRPTRVEPPRPPTARSNPEIAKHLTAAEAYGRENKWLQELIEAEAALKLDPRNVRAHLLAADAELGSGDLPHGCKYLHDLGKNPTARARAHQAGCPGD